MSVKRSLTQMLEDGSTIVAPGVFDPLGGRLVEHLGFDAVYMGGEVTGAHLAISEPRLTMTEQVMASGRVARAVGIPLIVDGNGGFGEVIHTMRAVEEFEAAGVAAIHIEDQHFPKRVHYHRGIEHVCERDEFLDKLRFALKARKSPEFKIIARTDAAKAVNADWEEAVWRCKAALDLGVDAVMPLVNQDDDTLQRIRDQLPDEAPVVILAGRLGQNERTTAEYRKRGFRIILYPIPSLVVALGAQWSLYSHLRDHDHVQSEGWIGFDVADYGKFRSLYGELIKLDDYVQIERETVEEAGDPAD